MRIVRLSLSNFRNYIRLETAFPRGPILLAGPNAQGKTSLLEAIYLFTHARSPLAENDRQLINFLALHEDQPFARLEAEVEDTNGPLRIELRLFYERTAAGEPRFRKDVLVNSVKRKPSELPGVFRALLFLPQELRVAISMRRWLRRIRPTGRRWGIITMPWPSATHCCVRLRKAAAIPASWMCGTSRWRSLERRCFWAGRARWPKSKPWLPRFTGA
jgi:hypothetical protein